MTYLNIVIDSVLKLLETLDFNAVDYYLKYFLHLDFRTPHILLLINIPFPFPFFAIKNKTEINKPEFLSFQ